MTRKDALNKMLYAVEDNDLSTISAETIYKAFGRHLQKKFWECFQSGSLDAAKALHEAVLPGWTWNVAQAQGYAWAMTYGHIGLHIEKIEVQAETTARAWLIAIINALIAQEDT